MNGSGRVGAHPARLAAYTLVAVAVIAAGWVFLVDTWAPR